MNRRTQRRVVTATFVVLLLAVSIYWLTRPRGLYDYGRYGPQWQRAAQDFLHGRGNPTELPGVGRLSSAYVQHHLGQSPAVVFLQAHSNHELAYFTDPSDAGRQSGMCVAHVGGNFYELIRGGGPCPLG